MRQIASLPTENQAQRFAAYLITQEIAAHAEENGDSFAIWIRDENQIDTAREELERFKLDPDHSRYEGVEQAADARQQEEKQRRQSAQKNVIRMGGRWKNPAAQKKPLTWALIGMSVAIGLFTWFGRDMESGMMRTLLFADTLQTTTWNINSTQDRLINIRQGQVWRVITPIFVHYSMMHLVFNMYMLSILGGQVENRQGMWRFAILVLLTGVISTVASSLVPQEWGGSPFGAGMSGVMYGVFGYMWMKMIYDPGVGLFLPKSTIIILMLWLFLGFTGVLNRLVGGQIDNWAHAFGLVSGMALAYAPVLFRRLGG